MMILGKRVLELRKSRNLTQEKLAEEMGLSIAAVSKWETGASMPDISVLCQLADYFQVSIDFLMGHEVIPSQYFLICDDSMFMCSMVTEILVKSGYAAKAVDNSGWLFKEIETRMPDGVLLDIHFPGENGLDILKRLKKEYPELPIVIVTADMTEETRSAAEALGAKDILYKPFSVEKINEAARTMVQ